MNCSHCSASAPENLITITKTWICPICTKKPFENFFPLKTVMQTIYQECKQASQQVKLVYVSDLDNNLDKINKHFRECVDLNNPLCTITLTRPSGVSMLHGPYDYVFLDSDMIDIPELLLSVPINPSTQVFAVEPIKQNVLTSDE